MKKNYKICLSVLLTIVMVQMGGVVKAQKKVVEEDYNRSSLCQFSIVHVEQSLSTEISNTLLEMESPERYNDHNLSVKILIATGDEEEEEVTTFLSNNLVAKRLVAKWFNRNKEDGSFDISTIQERGNYSASFEDVEEAKMNVRGLALLEDAGEQLIGNTFVLVNDIWYIDKEARAQKFTAVMANIAEAAGSFSGSGGSLEDVASLVQTSASLAGTISNQIAGFTVKTKSYLYRLKWDDKIAESFYTKYYYDKDHIDPDKKIAFERDRKTFQLEYIGEYSEKSAKTVMRGLHDRNDVFMKVLTRAIDENIVKLQKQHSVFSVTTVINDIVDKEVRVKIGLKEGVSTKSKYEVLERKMDENGKYTYTRKGVIKPIANLIWDNRYMAFEEHADNANLDYTAFEIVSGGDFYPGMLVREIK